MRFTKLEKTLAILAAVVTLIAAGTIHAYASHSKTIVVQDCGHCAN